MHLSPWTSPRDVDVDVAADVDVDVAADVDVDVAADVDVDVDVAADVDVDVAADVDVDVAADVDVDAAADVDVDVDVAADVDVDVAADVDVDVAADVDVDVAADVDVDVDVGAHVAANTNISRVNMMTSSNATFLGWRSVTSASRSSIRLNIRTSSRFISLFPKPQSRLHDPQNPEAGEDNILKQFEIPGGKLLQKNKRTLETDDSLVPSYKDEDKEKRERHRDKDSQVLVFPAFFCFFPAGFYQLRLNLFLLHFPLVAVAEEGADKVE